MRYRVTAGGNTRVYGDVENQSEAIHRFIEDEGMTAGHHKVAVDTERSYDVYISQFIRLETREAGEL